MCKLLLQTVSGTATRNLDFWYVATSEPEVVVRSASLMHTPLLAADYELSLSPSCSVVAAKSIALE